MLIQSMELDWCHEVINCPTNQTIIQLWYINDEDYGLPFGGGWYDDNDHDDDDDDHDDNDIGNDYENCDGDDI